MVNKNVTVTCFYYYQSPPILSTSSQVMQNIQCSNRVKFEANRVHRNDYVKVVRTLLEFRHCDCCYDFDTTEMIN